MSTIAEQIETSQATISSWTSDPRLAVQGLIFAENHQDVFDTLITTYHGSSDWLNVFVVKRLAELCGYHSPTIDAKLKDALSNINMFSSYDLPETDTDWFELRSRQVLHGFRYSEELNHETSKWGDPSSAYDGLKVCRDDFGKSFYRCDPDTPQEESLYGTRWFNVSNLADCFLILYARGVQDAWSYALQEWTYLNSTHWSTNHYIYGPTWASWENSFFEAYNNFAELYLLNNRSLTSWTQIITDIQNRFWSDGWESPQWYISPDKYYACVHHHGDNSQRRLTATGQAWLTAHMYYSQLSDACKTNLKAMLRGTDVTSAWDGLLNDSGLFDSGTDQFRKQTGDSVSDTWTAEGCFVLFMEAIIPGTGCLAVPLRGERCHVYGGVPYSKSFRCDVDNRKIRIPVHQGSLSFQFGSEEVSYTFAREGVYTLYFTEDWNTIVKVVQVSGLPGRRYLYHPIITDSFYRRLERSRTADYTAAEVVWRKLVLGPGRDGATGWFTKNYSEKEITVYVAPNRVATRVYTPGAYTSFEYVMLSAYAISNGDQIVYQDRVYEVEDVEEVLLKGSLAFYKCRIVQLPLMEIA